MRKLKNRIAVVTGAAGGIGRATSVALANHGCHLAISDVDMEGLEQTADLIKKLGCGLTVHQVDVSDKERMRTYADEVITAHGGVNILVNNAGVTMTATVQEHSIEDFEWLLGINLFGVIHGCKFFLPYLLEADEAHIVNISSVFGLVGVPTQASYCASKFAVRGFTEALWAEMKTKGVGVTSVHPAAVKTDIARSARTVCDNNKSSAIKIIDAAGVSPEYAAGKIILAIRKNKMRQLIARDAYAFDIFKRLMPGSVQHAIRYQWERMQAKTLTKS